MEYDERKNMTVVYAVETRQLGLVAKESNSKSCKAINDIIHKLNQNHYHVRCYMLGLFPRCWLLWKSRSSFIDSTRGVSFLRSIIVRSISDCISVSCLRLKTSSGLSVVVCQKQYFWWKLHLDHHHHHLCLWLCCYIRFFLTKSNFFASGLHLFGIWFASIMHPFLSLQKKSFWSGLCFFY